MEEKLVSFEVAKLAKKLGFDEEGHFIYSDVGKLFPKQIRPSKNSSPNISGRELFSAPTQGLLQKWLRDVHKLHLEIGMHELHKWCYGIQDISSGLDHAPRIAKSNVWDFGDYSSYEKALEKGLFESLTLKLIK